MTKRTREVALVGLAVVVAVVCVRLGIWQLDRLAERRAYNASVSYDRVTVRGRYDPAQELVLVNRPRRGSPGVNILTPLRMAGRDTAVLVNRGWVYSPDATRIDLDRWREDSARDEPGYLRAYDTASGPRPAAGTRGVRTLDYGAIAARIPYPIAPYLVVLTNRAGDTVAHLPARLDEPTLDEGSHLSYAFQWFSFAVIAVAGTLVFLRQSRRSQDSRFIPK